MAKFRVKYFGSNDVPVDLIKPILDEIDAELVIARPTTDAEIIEAGRDADGIIMHGAVPFTKEIISQLKKTKVVCRTGVGVDHRAGVGEDPGVVDPDVEAAEPLHGQVGEGHHRRLVGHVDPDANHAPVVHLLQLLGHGGGSLAVEVGQDHFGAGLGQPGGDVGPDAPGGAGDDSGPPGQRHELGQGRAAVVGDGERHAATV